MTRASHSGLESAFSPPLIAAPAPIFPQQTSHTFAAAGDPDQNRNSAQGSSLRCSLSRYRRFRRDEHTSEHPVDCAPHLSLALRYGRLRPHRSSPPSSPSFCPVLPRQGLLGSALYPRCHLSIC